MLLGGWGVYFTVQAVWRTTYGESYFGSRDIDLGFHTPREASIQDLQRGNLPATVAHLERHGFTRQGMYQFLRFHDFETNATLSAQQAAGMPTFAFYAIAVELIMDEQRPDAREIANFQAFSEPLLQPAFKNAFDRRSHTLQGVTVNVPAPHVLLAMKLTSFPNRHKDDKVVKDLCDAYALATASGVDVKTLRNRLHRTKPDAANGVQGVLKSPFLPKAADHLEVRPQLIQQALRGLL